MKSTTISSILLLLSLNIYSQKAENDTLPNKRFVKSSWAIKIESGAVYNQMFNEEYIDNGFTQITDLTVFYKNVYFTYGAFIREFKPLTNMNFYNVTVNKSTEFHSFNLNVGLGYSYNINKNWSADIGLGLNTTNFEISNSKDVNIIYKSDYLTGYKIGLGLDRYIKLKRFNYIVIGFGMDYYTTQYSKISPDMSTGSINYTLSIGYKGFFRRMID